MAKAKTQFICQNCGTVHSRWAGKCDGCGEWNTIVEDDPMGGIGSGPGKAPKKGRPVTLTSLSGEIEEAPRIPTGIGELDGEPESMVFALPKELRLRLVD